MARERRRRRGGSTNKSDAHEVPKAPAYIKGKYLTIVFLVMTILVLLKKMQILF